MSEESTTTTSGGRRGRSVLATVGLAVLVALAGCSTAGLPPTETATAPPPTTTVDLSGISGSAVNCSGMNVSNHTIVAPEGGGVAVRGTVENVDAGTLMSITVKISIYQGDKRVDAGTIDQELLREGSNVSYNFVFRDVSSENFSRYEVKPEISPGSC